MPGGCGLTGFREARDIGHLIGSITVACLLLIISNMTHVQANDDCRSDSDLAAGVQDIRISSLMEDEVVIHFSHPDVVDGSYGFELSATISNVTTEMTVTLYLEHITSMVLRNYTMFDIGSGTFVTEVPGPMNTGSHLVWVSVRQGDSEVAASTVTPMTVVDWTRPTIWAHGLRFEEQIAVFWVNCSDAYSIDHISLLFSTDGPDPGDLPSRRFSLVEGTIFNGSWEYRMELDSESYFQYIIYVSDAALGLSTGYIFYNKEAYLEEELRDAVITWMVMLLALVAMIILVVGVLYRSRTRTL